MLKIYTVLLFLATSLSAMAKPHLFDNSIFKEKASWTWSYSEKDSQTKEWAEPYLYETYEVVKRVGNLVTIEMSSGDSLFTKTEPHHRFTVDIQDCKDQGVSMQRLKRFHITLYTKSFNGDWKLVTKRNKALAMTEKFNCFSGRFRSRVRVVENGDENLSVEQWANFPIESWYISDDSKLKGVAHSRYIRNYRMFLERTQ